MGLYEELGRRRFLQTIAVLPLVSSSVALAQQGRKIFRVGWLQVDSTPDGVGLARLNMDLLRPALKAQGYVEGVNMILDDRSLIGGRDRASEAVADLVRLQTDVLVVRTALEAAIAKTVTKAMPIVFVAISDPVGLKLVDSLARPGGNITGVSYMGTELTAKRLQLLRQMVPSASRIAVLGQAGHPLLPRVVEELQRAGRSLKVEIHVVEIKSADELDDAFITMTRAGDGALLVTPSPIFGASRVQIASLALKHRLPSMFEIRRFVDAGGLMSYGPDDKEMFARTAYYVDRILKGAKAGDLPVEQGTKLNLRINAKTAKALGLVIPPELLLTAEQTDS
jgi:putative ABC transport system substrate-binding protein